MHGTLMLLFFATPLAVGFANYLVPLQIGAAGHGLPAPQRPVVLAVPVRRSDRPVRLPDGRRRGCRGLDRLRAAQRGPYSPGPGMDLWIVGVGLVGVSGILGALNFIVTIFTPPRARDDHVPHADVHLDDPGDRGADPVRLPVAHGGAWRCCSSTATSAAASSTPPGAATRSCGSTSSGSSATRRSTSSILPFFGIMSEVVPVFSQQAALRLPLDGARVHRDRGPVDGASGPTTCSRPAPWTCPSSASLSFLIAVPTGIKIFNWIATMWRGSLRFPVAMLWCARAALRVHDRRHHRRDGRVAAARLQRPGHLLRGRPPPQRAHRRDTCSRCSPGSTSGSRRRPAGCLASGSAGSTSRAGSSASA